jgi:DNA mismatch repair ATPase MutS
MDLYLYYKQRVSQFSDKEKECLTKERKLPFYRLAIIVTGIAAFIFLFKTSILISVIVLLLFLAFFIVFVVKDNRNSAKKKEHQLLKMLNENEIQYLDGKYNLSDDGGRYKKDSHPYSNDLDIFGDSSLYHFINRTTLSKSSDILADWLLFPAGEQEIKERNEAIIELSNKIDWRQKIFIRGYSIGKTGDSIKNLIGWVKKSDKFSFKKRHILFCSILSGITFSSLILSFIFSVPYIILAFLLGIHYLIIRKASAIVKSSHADVTNNSKILETYAAFLNDIEKEQFHSRKLHKLKDQLKSENYFASMQIKKLSAIVNRFDLRYNVFVYFFLNTLFFWDIHQVFKLEKWKNANKDIEQWFQCVGEFEALSSLANLYFNNPNWCFPKISEKYFFFEAADLGHPLINAKDRVCNNLAIDGSGKILLLSGSNMSGKSTFLRSVGVNIILAMAGSCVCAKDFIFSPVRILSSMRISDSLKDNTSSFFAELKKLEFIIKEAEKKGKVFLLLDEILRGTNSIDRHIGSTALIKQLISNEAVGILATHDLALTEMSREFPANIENYNFNIKINNEDLYFDYLLNKGVCTSLNASILMKKMGINI